MALVTCPECKKQVSDTAKTCPCCGYKMNSELVKQRKKTIKRMLLLVLLAVVAIGLPIYIHHYNVEVERARIEYEKWVFETTLPQSYDEYYTICCGVHDRWELNDESISSAYGIHIIINKAKSENIPFKESVLYENWENFIRAKKK